MAGVPGPAAPPGADFMRALTGSQFELYAYVCALLGGTESARDVLQETNVDLWNKASTYDPRRPFLPWARAIAFYQVLTHRRKAAPSRPSEASPPQPPSLGFGGQGAGGASRRRRVTSVPARQG